MKKRFRTWLTSFLAGISALSLVGGTIFTFTDKTVNAAAEKVAVKPYLEYKFDDSANPWKNTGSASNGNMTAWGKPQNVGSWGLKVTESGSYDGGIYLRIKDKEDSLVKTDEFTFSTSFYIDGRASWHSVPISWTSFSTSQKKKVSRTYALVPSSSTSSWMKFGDTDLTDGGNIAQQWYTNEGKELIPNNSSTNPGWTNLVVSVKAGGKAYVKARVSNGTVYELEYDVPADWTLFDTVNGDDFVFALGASFTYNNSDATQLSESKSKMQFDNVRFYDVAMTETQIDSYISNVGGTVYTYGVVTPDVEGGTVSADKTSAMLGEKVTFTVNPDAGASVKSIKLNGAEVALDGNNQFSAVMTSAGMEVEAEFTLPAPTYTAEIRPELEYLFNSEDNLFVNTGNASGYTLSHSGTVSDGFNSNFNCYYFNNNSTLYLQTKGENTNNWFYDNDVNTFTVALDTQAYRNLSSNWWQSAMNWVTLADGSNAKSNLSALMVGYNSSYDWFGYTDSTLSTEKSGVTWYTNMGDIVYAGDKAAANSGWVRIIYSVQPGGKAYVKIYDLTTTDLLGYVSYDVPATWSPYGSGNDFTFSLGGSFTKNGGTYSSAESRYVGNMDNVRIYDFAMTEEQMETYAKSGKVLTSGIQIAKSDNGQVSVEDNKPAIGSEVVLNVTPDTGYEVDQIFVNGTEIQAVDGVYQTTMIRDGLYVEATFKKMMKIVAAEAVSMARGAGVRYGGGIANSGLRFQMVASQADYEGLAAKIPSGATVEYGILVIPADYQTTYGAFTVENFFGANAKYHMAEKNDDGSLKAYDGTLPQIMNFWTSELYLNEETGNYEYFGSITGIKVENLTRKFVGVGVVKYTEGGETQYVVVEYAGSDIANNTRSIYQVAKLAEQDAKLNASAKLWIQQNYIQVVENAVTDLSGKKLSILGDSISTYIGVSNDANANATIGGNAVCYGKDISSTVVGLDDTWWMQAANNTDMNILVNNSWAGSNVATNYSNETKGGCTARAENLHDVNGVTPDIIAVYMGINDCGCLTDLGEFDSVSDVWDGTQYVGDTEKFATAYATMVHKLTTKYDAAEVFLFTLPRNGYLWQGTKEEYNALQDAYNKMIYKIADIFGCEVVDLATAVGDDYENYLLGDEIHPNAKGMDIITAAFETALYSYYYETLN